MGVEENLAGASGYEQVGQAIVVIICDRNSHTVEFDIQTRSGSDVGKRAVPIVAIQAKSAALLFMAGPVHSVHQQNVLPSVAVIIKKSAARTHRFRKEFSAKRAAVVTELYAGGRCYVDKSETGRNRCIPPRQIDDTGYAEQ